MPTFSLSDVQAAPPPAVAAPGAPGKYSLSDVADSAPEPDGNSMPASPNAGKGPLQGLWDSTVGGLVQTAKHYGIDVPVEHQRAIAEALSKGDLAGALSHAVKMGIGLSTGNGLITDMAKAQGNEFVKAKDALSDPQGGSVPMRVSTAAGHTLAGLLPGAGPAAAQAGEDVGNPDTRAYGAGEAVGTLLPFAGGIPGVPEVAGKAGGLAQDAAEGAATKIYRSTLKPSTALPIDEANKVVQTGLRNGIPISEGGYRKLSQLVQNLSDATNATIKQGAAAGKTVDPAAVAQRVDQIRSKFANQVNPTSDLAALASSKQEFLDRNSTPGKPGVQLFGPNGQPMTVGATPPSVNPIPVDQAQAMKQGTYKQLSGKYGELGSAEVEAQKALARGLKEEIYKQFPELQGIASKEGDLLGLGDQLERAVNRIHNHNELSLTAAAAHNPALSVMIQAMQPAVKSRIAIGLVKAFQAAPYVKGAARVTLPMANQRVDDWANQLQDAAAQPAQ